MKSNTALLLGLGGAVAWWLYANRQAATSTIETGVETVQAAIQGWKTVKDGPKWVPVLNAAESQFGIPPDLLARIAYQETHFRPEYIDGTQGSPAGALGLMQMLPRYFSSVRVPVPFTDQDTAAQIQQAAAELMRLYTHYNDWSLAVAAYNDGQGQIDAYVASLSTDQVRTLPDETVNYVAQVFADVPVPNTQLA